MSADNVKNDTGGNATAGGGIASVIGHYRWWICALLFFCTTINYIDRNSLSVLKTTLERELGWTAIDYGWITTAFTFAYGLFPSLIGFFVDRVGVKKALAGALILWSIAAAAHGLVATVLGFVIVRFVLGLAEAANFPASIKAVAMWFPQKERALATGIFNSGTSIGVIVSGVSVWIAVHWGWQMAFVFIGLIGLVWLFFWQMFFDVPEKQKRLGAAELEYIRAGQPPAEKSVKVPWTTLLRYREIWPFVIGKFITDPVWWFYLFWLPDYLEKGRGLPSLGASGWIAVIYTGASVGSIAGGWLSGHLMRRGWSVGRARMTTMLIAAVCMPVSILAYFADSFVACVAFITLATGAHQAWSANLFTNATDLFPQKVSGSVVGLGATAGGIGGMFMTLLVGMAVQWTGNQQMVFIWAAGMHLTSLAIFWFWFKGRHEQISVDGGIDLTRRHGGLTIAGTAVCVFGVLLAWFVAHNWNTIAGIVKISGAAQTAVVAGGVIIIGLALLYASRPRKSQLTE